MITSTILSEEATSEPENPSVLLASDVLPLLRKVAAIGPQRRRRPVHGEDAAVLVVPGVVEVGLESRQHLRHRGTALLAPCKRPLGPTVEQLS